MSEPETMSNMQKIYILLRKQTGHDFSNYKQNTIFRRIERRMAVHHIEKIKYYIRYLQENPKEIETLFKELLIGVTGFFRDCDAFESLKNKVLSEYLKEKPNDYSLRIWVPGCSTGEEVYSIAIIVKECMELLNKDFNVQIFGTDIDADAIETARVGIYPMLIANDVGYERLQRFFTEDGNSYRISKVIREMIVFAPQNIIKEPPFTKLDLLSCRNLLIYLNYELQKKIYPLFHYALKPNGYSFFRHIRNHRVFR
ncbi:MAG: protein-glutamate O-methyltransferase CheR [Desulfobacteraceae bacterium]|nr:protein-glutamate O-methyltransferase CheR [Desulfobacteraceae bacterium]